MDATESVVKFVQETSLSDIPMEVIQKSKDPFLDTVGLLLAGSVSRTSKIASEVVKEIGGTPEATIIGAGFKSCKPNAAFANGISCHVEECDDADLEILLHPSTVLVPTILAVGEAIGASGGHILEAYIIGWEVIGGIGRAIQGKLEHLTRGWHTTSTVGTFGATVAAAKLLKLDPNQIRMALGIAVSEAAGCLDQFGTMGKAFHAGNAARNGIMAAMLAEKGFTATPNGLEAFFRVYNGEGRYDPTKVGKKLGSPYTFMSPGIVLKKYACSCPLQVALSAMQELVKREKFNPEDVESIGVGIAPELGKIFFPRDTAIDPVEAHVNELYVIAAGITYPDLIGLSPFEPERVSNPTVQNLMRKIKLYTHPELAKGLPIKNHLVHFFSVRLQDGRQFDVRADSVSGLPDKPMSRTELLAKYRDCTGRVLDPSRVEQSIGLLTNLEKMEDVRELVKILDARA